MNVGSMVAGDPDDMGFEEFFQKLPGVTPLNNTPMSSYTAWIYMREKVAGD